MDSITNTVTIIKNGYLARKQTVDVPCSNVNKAVLNKMVEVGFLESVSVEEKGRRLKVCLLYQNSEPAISGIERISKPSLRFYTSVNKIPRVLGGIGEVIISTPKGILTGKQAKKANLGGELLFKVW